MGPALGESDQGRTPILRSRFDATYEHFDYDDLFSGKVTLLTDLEAAARLGFSTRPSPWHFGQGVCPDRRLKAAHFGKKIHGVNQKYWFHLFNKSDPVLSHRIVDPVPDFEEIS
jgi:hypothetical protein